MTGTTAANESMLEIAVSAATGGIFLADFESVEDAEGEPSWYLDR